MKKSLKALLVCLMVITAVFTVQTEDTQAASQKAVSIITDVKKVKGSQFTGSEILAKKLDKVFKGNTGLRKTKDGTKVYPKLGTKIMKNNSSCHYVYTSPKGNNSGTSCYIGAAAAYNTLFGDGTFYSSYKGTNSENVSLSGKPKFTYANFVKYKVKTGAYMRISRNGGGHSIIVLSYDKKYVTYLDYNGDGNGLAAVRTYKWSNLENCIKNGWISTIIQPRDSYYYPTYFVKDESISAVQTANKTITLSGIANNVSGSPIDFTLDVIGPDYELRFYGRLENGANDITKTFYLVPGVPLSNIVLNRVTLDKPGKYKLTISYEVNGKTINLYKKNFTVK